MERFYDLLADSCWHFIKFRVPMQRDRFSPPELAQGLSGSPTTVLLILTMNFQQLQIPRPPHPCQNPMVHKEPVASHALILKVREFALAPSQLIVSDIHSLKKKWSKHRFWSPVENASFIVASPSIVPWICLVLTPSRPLKWRCREPWFPRHVVPLDSSWACVA